MATIVLHNPTGERYILLGAGFGAYQSKRPSWMFGNLIPAETNGRFALVCVCTNAGKIGWIDSSELTVESVDGQSPIETLG